MTTSQVTNATTLDGAPSPRAAAALPQGALRLDEWGVLRARGADAAAFLQGQLTSDIAGLDAGEARLAGYCSAKGRLIGSFVVWRPAAEEFLLACSAELVPALLKRLSMFVLRAKCKLDDASAEVALWGLAGPAATAWLGAAAPARIWQRAHDGDRDLVRLPDALLHGNAVARYIVTGAEAPPLPALGAAEWRGLEAASGTARIVGATVEQFVPQMVNLELVGGVSFKKGCYPGQEVVARSQYRGTLKRRAYLLAAATPLSPGQEVFHDADPGQPAGMVVLAGHIGGEHVALVELKIAALHEGRLHAGAGDGPTLQPRALPYEIPAEAA